MNPLPYSTSKNCAVSNSAFLNWTLLFCANVRWMHFLQLQEVQKKSAEQSNTVKTKIVKTVDSYLQSQKSIGQIFLTEKMVLKILAPGTLSTCISHSYFLTNFNISRTFCGLCLWVPSPKAFNQQFFGRHKALCQPLDHIVCKYAIIMNENQFRLPFFCLFLF